MDIGLAHDMIVGRGGGERVLKCFHESYPGAPIYTTAWKEHLSYSEFREYDIRTTWYNRLVNSDADYKKYYFPLGLIAAYGFKIPKHDVVLQSTTHGAKYYRYHPSTFVVSYCFTPFRLAWNAQSYSQYDKAKGVKKIAYNLLTSCLRNIELQTARRVNVFWAMTENTAKRIESAYGRQCSKVINPPVDCSLIKVSPVMRDYYLVVSRLEYYKRVDLVVEAFNYLNLPLIVVGEGTRKKELNKLANDNITFKQGVSDQELSRLYQECRAFVFPQEEDYGITPLEAAAAGRPVIAYGKGGVLDTMIPLKYDARHATSVFFEEQTVDSLIEAVRQFNKVRFDAGFIRKHAEKYDVPQFISKVQNGISEEYEKFMSGI